MRRNVAILTGSTLTFGRPRRLPFALAFRRPDFTRSTIKLRSNSATAPRTVNTMRPAGVAVSSDSDRLTNSIPRTRNVSSALSKCETDRAKRSNFQTATTSSVRATEQTGFRHMGELFAPNGSVLLKDCKKNERGERAGQQNQRSGFGNWNSTGYCYRPSSRRIRDRVAERLRRILKALILDSKSTRSGG